MVSPLVVGSVPAGSPLWRLAAQRQAFWSLTLYPDAGEAGGSFQSARRTVVVPLSGVPAADPERARAEAARRARAKLRRYAVANGLNRLGTLTYAGEGNFDTGLVRDHAGEFFRKLRDLLGGKSFPYVWVPEWHKKHGLHLHFAVGRFIDRSVIDAAWGRGFIKIKLLSDLPIGSGTREESRRAAGYLSKYVSKTFDVDQGLSGRHRYEVGQGFQPDVKRFTGWSGADVLAQACQIMGSEPIRRWSSDEVEGWDKPPAVWFQWA